MDCQGTGPLPSGQLSEETPSLPPGFSRETTIRRDRRGRWFHDGEIVENDSVRRAFNRWIDRADDGRYCLKNEVNWAYVEIEGPPLFVVGADVRDDEVVIALSDERTETLDPTTIEQDDAGHLYCSARNKTFDAMFTNAAAVALAPLLEGDPDGEIELVLGEKRYPIRTRPASST